MELTGLMRPFDLELFLGDRVAVLGANGSGRSYFLRLLADSSFDRFLLFQSDGDVVERPAPIWDESRTRR